MPARAQALLWQTIFWLYLLASAGFLIWQHAANFHSTWSDENVHLYVARRAAEGARLYDQLHSARPPLAILAPATLIRLGLPPLLAGRCLVAGATLLTAALLLGAGWRLRSRWAGLAAAVCYLLAPTIAAVYAFTGMRMVAFWTALCVAAALLGRWRLAGLAAAASLLTGQHGLVLIGASALVIARRQPCALPGFALLAGGLPAVVCAGFWLTGSQGIWQDLVGHHAYHLDAAPTASAKLSWWLGIMAMENAHLPLLALAAALLLRSGPATGKLGVLRSWSDQPEALLLAMAGLHIASILLMQGGLSLYVGPAIPILALAAGLGAWRLARELRRREPGNLAPRLAVISLLAMAATVVAGWAGAQARLEKRDKRDDYSLLPYRTHARMSRVSEPVVADSISADLAAQGHGTLFGHATIVDLVALQTGARIAADLADIAPRWFKLGTLSRQHVVEQVEADGVTHFITPNWYYPKDPYFKVYLQRCYAAPQVYPRENGIPRMLVYRHQEQRPCLVNEEELG